MADSTAAKGTQSNPYTMDEFENMSKNGTWTGGYVNVDGEVMYLMLDVLVEGYSCGSISGETSTPKGDFEFDSYKTFSSDQDKKENDDNTDDEYGRKDDDQDNPNPNGNGMGGGGSTGGNHGGTYNTYPQGIETFSKMLSLWGIEGYGTAIVTFLGNYNIIGNIIDVYIETGTIFPDITYNAELKIFRDNELFLDHVFSEDSLKDQNFLYETGHKPLGIFKTTLPNTGKVRIEIIMGITYNSGSGRFSNDAKYSKELN